MKIHEYQEMMQWLTRPAEPRRSRTPFRGAGLVDHGPPGVRQGYAVNWTPERLANRQTWMDNTGSTLEDYNKLPYDTRSNIRFGRITGIKQTAEFGKQKESAATKEFRNWLSKQDPKTLTSESVDDLIKQSKIKTTSRTRPGLVMAINRITEEKEFAKFKNIQLGRAYSQENINQLSDDLLKAYAKDDITLVMDPKHKTSISDIRINRRSALDKAIKNTGLDEETIFNLLDDRDAYVALEKKQATTKGRPVEEGKAKFYKQAENWIIKNSKRYEDPDKFKKAFTRTFGKDNHLIQRISKGTATSIPFSDWFRTSIMGTSEQAMRGQVKPTYTSSQLDNIFKTAIYTNNKNVRDKITKEIKNILPESASKRIPDVRKALNESLLLKKFGLNYEIKGPIARLLAKEIGDDLIKKISLFRKPWLGTPELLTYLKDIVDPKYQSMFEESIKAIKYAQKNQWPEAKKALNLSQSIMFDHKIPKALIGLGYADEIEYIKLHPTSQQFNAIIKNSEFDKPLVKLTKKWAEAETPNAKAKVVGEMNELKDNFSKKYGGYLDEVTITPDKTGKPIFSSTTDVVTKDTDLVKSLETSLQHEKFPTMTESQKSNFSKMLEIFKTSLRNDLVPADQVKIADAFGCRGKKAKGGRIGYADGSVGMLACIDAKFQENPKGFFQKVKGLPIKGLQVLTKAITPFLLPLPSLAMEASSGEVPDPTSAETWLGPAFWSEAMTGLGVTKDTLGHKILRAGMTPSTVAKVSRFSGPALMATAAVDRGKAMANTFKKAEALGIPVENYVDRSSGVIEATDELYDEIRRRESGQGMDYAKGGIAGLIIKG